MGVAGIDIVQNTYEPVHSTNASERVAETPHQSAQGHTDTVRISQEARNLAANGQAALGEGSTDQALPVEAYSLPGWYGGLMSDLTIIDIKLGQPYSESSMARYDALSSREKNDLSEYHGKLHQYFQEGLREQGIEGAVDYYNQIVRDPVKSEEVHQAVKQKLLADERAMQLAEYFGISV